jgi:hypothetical protein
MPANFITKQRTKFDVIYYKCDENTVMNFSAGLP